MNFARDLKRHHETRGDHALAGRRLTGVIGTRGGKGQMQVAMRERHPGEIVDVSFRLGAIHQRDRAWRLTGSGGVFLSALFLYFAHKRIFPPPFGSVAEPDTQNTDVLIIVLLRVIRRNRKV